MVDHHDLPMVVITDNKDDFSVFPPINHENLNLITNHQTPSSQSQSQLLSTPSSSSPSFSTSDSDKWGEFSSLSPPLDSSVRKGGDFIGWMSIGFQILRSKFLSAVSSCRNPGGAIRSYGLPAAVVVIIVVMMMKRKESRRNLTPNESRLLKIIMEKDGKIAQLLHQIAQMNEILIDSHKALTVKKG
ncbi:uncharacterized protein LOC131635066 [Vicia villosa]|uniref:uncharacterized protein LOC131635066 n=1 Tax=Vicia villosa TaxID=3911 RepID=UPI00273C65C2|nr:uncharacterized protein LOC131635066 [Vicia villosa]